MSTTLASSSWQNLNFNFRVNLKSERCPSRTFKLNGPVFTRGNDSDVVQLERELQLEVKLCPRSYTGRLRDLRVTVTGNEARCHTGRLEFKGCLSRQLGPEARVRLGMRHNSGLNDFKLGMRHNLNDFNSIP